MSTVFVMTEVLAYGVGFLFLLHALRHKHAPLLVTAILYGFLLEYHTVRTETAYCYGRFLVMLPPWPAPPEAWCATGPRVPFWGSVAWGYFIYSAMQTSSRIAMPWYVRPLMDGLLVLTFDWILDPVAVQFGFWVWEQPGEFFGIPLDNYFGWFMVAASFSFVYRWLTRRTALGAHRALVQVALLALLILLAILLLAAGLVLFLRLAALGLPQSWMLAATLLGAAACVMPPLVRARGTSPRDNVLVALVAGHHLYNGALMVGSGLLAAEPLLGIVWLSAFTLAMIGYAWPAYGAPRAGVSSPGATPGAG